MDWPGSTITGVAIIGNFAEISFLKGSVSNSMLATNTTGSWVKIHKTEGCYTAEDIVKVVPAIPFLMAQELDEQNTQSRVHGFKTVRTGGSREKVEVYNQYQMQGNVAGRHGDFDSAITAWTKAEALDPSYVKGCQGESERVQIRAARDAQARMEALHLTKEEAASWFEQHEGELWMRSCCDLP